MYIVVQSCATCSRSRGVAAELHVVVLVQVSYTEASTDDGTTTLDDAANNRIPNLHAWRDEVS